MKITQVDLYEVDVPDRPWAWSDEEFGMPGHRKATYCSWSSARTRASTVWAR